MEPRRWMTARELAEELGISPSTVRAWTRHTDMPRIHAGRLVRFAPAEVIEWLRDGGTRRTRPIANWVGVEQCSGAIRLSDQASDGLTAASERP